jgi:hypothetical protein
MESRSRCELDELGLKGADVLIKTVKTKVNNRVI